MKVFEEEATNDDTKNNTTNVVFSEIYCMKQGMKQLLTSSPSKRNPTTMGVGVYAWRAREFVLYESQIQTSDMQLKLHHGTYIFLL